jgi:hypothetical protein
VVTSHPDDEVGLVDHGSVDRAAPVPGQVEAAARHRRLTVRGGRSSAGVQAGRRHPHIDPNLIEAMAQEHLGHRRSALVGGAEQEHVDGCDCRCAGLAP